MDIGKELERLLGKVDLGGVTSKLTDSVTSKAKESAISTLNDPEFKATVNQFTREWIEEHKVILVAVFGSLMLFVVMAIANIVSNFAKKR